jgi:hypothetical protein
VLTAHGVEAGEDLLLNVEALDDGLDDPIAGAERLVAF